MYATIHEFRCPADAEPGIREVVAGCLPTGADPAGLLALADVADPGRGTAVALWTDEPATDGRVYRVDRRDARPRVGPAARCSPRSPG